MTFPYRSPSQGSPNYHTLVLATKINITTQKSRDSQTASELRRSRSLDSFAPSVSWSIRVPVTKWVLLLIIYRRRWSERLQVNFPSGIAHFLEKLAFQSTKQFASRDIIMQKLEQYGGICDCQISRDATVYAASVEIDGYDGVVEMLNEVSRRMVITEDEVRTFTDPLCRFNVSSPFSVDTGPPGDPVWSGRSRNASWTGTDLDWDNTCGELNRPSVFPLSPPFPFALVTGTAVDSSRLKTPQDSASS